MPADIQWPPFSGAARLADDEIHVWAVPLDIAPPRLETLAATLSLEETARAERFKFAKHRHRFIAGRGALREILSQYLRVQPRDIPFDYSPNGKPTLAGEFSLHFNLAHTEDLALIALTRIGPVGVDVERVRPIKDVDDLVARFFSPRESELFQKVAPHEKPAAFFNLWTRKEALLKATGEGITRSLSLVEVSFLPGDPARLLSASGDPAKAAQWTLRELTPAPGFAGAMAIQAQSVSVRCGTCK
jgi:4'-phosphopantetheinyl transferase